MGAAAPNAPAAARQEPEPLEEPGSFFRRQMGEPLDFDANDEGFTPNFSKMKDDLDVPAFLRKQMD